MNAYGGVEVSGLLASRPSRLISCVRAPGTYWIGGRVGLRPGLDAVVKINETTLLLPEIELRSSNP